MWWLTPLTRDHQCFIIKHDLYLFNGEWIGRFLVELLLLVSLCMYYIIILSFLPKLKCYFQLTCCLEEVCFSTLLELLRSPQYVPIFIHWFIHSYHLCPCTSIINSLTVINTHPLLLVWYKYFKALSPISTQW